MNKKRSQDAKGDDKKRKKTKGDVDKNDVFIWLSKFLKKHGVIEVKNSSLSEEITFQIIGIGGEDIITSVGYRRNGIFYPKLTQLLSSLESYGPMEIQQFKDKTVILLPEYDGVGTPDCEFPFKCLIPKESQLEPYVLPPEQITKQGKMEINLPQTSVNGKNLINSNGNAKLELNQHPQNFWDNLENSWIQLFKVLPNDIQKSIQEKLFPGLKFMQQLPQQLPQQSIQSIQSKPATIEVPIIQKEKEKEKEIEKKDIEQKGDKNQIAIEKPQTEIDTKMESN